VIQADRDFAEPLQQVERTCVLWRGKKLGYFGGCDYFRLSSDPRVVQAVSDGLRRYGLNVAASRKTTGNHVLYERIETEAARFFGAECARLVSSGYLANIVAAQALRATIAHVLIDERAHASLQDAALFLQCRVTRFNHRDSGDLAKKLAQLKDRSRVALLTDGLFAHDGSFAPLRSYRQILGANGLLWVDDSHAAGVTGDHGEGSLGAAGLNRHNTVQTITFSKAFGVYGGAVLCDAATGGRILNQSSAIVGNTPLPLPLAAGVIASLKLHQSGARLRKKLRDNIELFWREIGATVATPLAPIIALTAARPERVRAQLLRQRIYPSLIRYPGGPPEGYFRFALSSEHSVAQISALANVLASAEILEDS
jgi:8-amino-7-oxononanoate synthase